MECLSCRLVINLQADELRIKKQILKELKAEIEKLEDQKSQEQVDEYGFPMNPEALHDEEATVTI